MLVNIFIVQVKGSYLIMNDGYFPMDYSSNGLVRLDYSSNGLVRLYQFSSQTDGEYRRLIFTWLEFII